MNDLAFDLDQATRDALAFDELLNMVAARARTEIGAAHVRSLHPGVDTSTVVRLHRLVSEVRTRFEKGAAPVGRAIPDPREAMGTLVAAGSVLEGLAARRLAGLLAAARSIKRQIGVAADESLLAAFGRSMPDLGDLGEAVLRGSEPDGSLNDDASPELAQIRRRQAVVTERIGRQLMRHLRQPGAEHVIRDDFITRRNGRFVIPVRSDAPRQVQGIVHGGSSSGATRFVEPLESVELNNELVTLLDAEREEVQRILACWTDELRARLPEIGRAVDAIAELDSLQARAIFGVDLRAVVPEVGEAQRLRLTEFRHPLLEQRLREEQAACVPTTLGFDEGHSVLVLSGPNTGGKTVALKAVGLGVLMAQSGIPLPADSMSLRCFRQLRADIGDHQSIDANLSTFSSHIGMVARSLAARCEPALFLFDELGTGTEPAEGAALARAILERLLESDVTVVATSHLSPIKHWAATTNGVLSAAMEFDSERLTPTYRVRMGLAGGSAGLEIASRLGIDAGIVRRARELVDPSIREAERMLSSLREAQQDAELARDQMREQLEQLVRDQEAARLALDRSLARSRKEASEKLARELEDFRKRVRKELGAIADDKHRQRLVRRVMRGEQQLKIEKSRIEDALAPGASREPVAPPLTRDQLNVGTEVLVSALGRGGRISAVRGEEVDVQLGALSLRVHWRDLSMPESPRDSTTTGMLRPVSSYTPCAPSCPAELVLVGKRVEEALDDLTRYLDAATWAELVQVRIVHGHGSGRLRRAVREFLDRQSVVRRHRPGGDGEGGEAVTIAELG